jgi:hypothetical protein
MGFDNLFNVKYHLFRMPFVWFAVENDYKSWDPVHNRLIIELSDINIRNYKLIGFPQWQLNR